jgi:hypothetical protein
MSPLSHIHTLRFRMLLCHCLLFHVRLSVSLVGKVEWGDQAQETELTFHLQSIRGDETVNVNKPSPVSPQLTARSGQSAQLV